MTADDQAQARSFRQRHPRHPAEVTADRLGDALDKWPERFDAGDRDMVARVRHVLHGIAEDGAQYGGVR
jgi:hypothetical protein